MIEDGGYLKSKPKAGNIFPLKGDINEKSLYVLKNLGTGSAADVAGKLADLEEIEYISSLEQKVEEALGELCKEGIIHCDLDEQVMIYRLVNLPPL